MTSEEYWTKRQLEREQFFHEMANKDLSQEIKKYYLSSLSKIQKEIAAFYAQYAKENQLTMQETRRLFRGEEFKLWRMELKDYVKKSKASSEILKELNTLAMRSRITRLEALHARTLMEVADLCEKLNEKENAIQYRAYVAHYYGNTYDIHKEIGLSTPPVAVDSKNVEQILKTAWSGKNYSQRIWKNGKKLEKEIQSTLVEAVHRGSSIQKLSKKLSERMEVGYHNAERLVRTELNYRENRATADAIKDAELDFYKFVATLDHRTTPTCQSLDGQVFSIEEMNQGTNAPPMHCRCRSTIIPTLGEGLVSKGNRSAKDAEGKRIKIPANMNYNDWKKVYIDKSQTLEQWQKNNLNKSAASVKINNNSSNSQKGLGAGDKIFMNVEGTPPKFIGRLPNLEKSTIEKTLAYFENQIANAKIENGFVITTNGEIYHCTGHQVGLPTIEDLGEKLKGAVVTHNHPDSFVNEHSFSGLDWSLFERYNLKILRGVEESFVYELNRNKDDSKLSDLILDGKDDLNGWHNVILIKALNKGYGYRRWRRE